MREAEHSDANIARYIREVVRHPLLSAAEERRLACRLRDAGDPAARRALVTANLRFVVKVAHGFAGYGLPMADLIQEGNCGLTVAVDKFDPTRGARLVTYAAWWIRAYIQSYVMSAWSLVKIGTTRAQRKLFFRLRGERQRAEMATGGEPGAAATGGEIARRLRVSVEDVRAMGVRLGERDGSLDQAVAPEGVSRLDLMVATTPAQDEQAIVGQRRRLLAGALVALAPGLSGHERFVVEARMLAPEPPTLAAVGRELRVSRERVRQLESGIVRKLRRAMAAHIPPARRSWASPPR